MTKKEARIEALRICTALINANSGQLLFEGQFTEAEEDKVRQAMDKISDALYNQAARLGGDFNEHTGFEHDKKINI